MTNTSNMESFRLAEKIKGGLKFTEGPATNVETFTKSFITLMFASKQSNLVSTLIQISTITRDLNNKFEAVRSLAKMKNDLVSSKTRSTLQFRSVVSRLQPYLKIIKSGKLPADLITEVLKLSSTFDRFQDKHKDFVGFFDKLKTFKEGLDPVSAALRVVSQLRKLKNNQAFFETFQKVTTTLTEFPALLKPIRNAFEAIKSNQKKEVEALTALKELKKFSKSFGEIANYIANTGKVMEMRSHLEFFVTNGSTVVDTLEAATVPKNALLLQEASESWDDFSNTSSNILNLIGKIESWKASLQQPASDDLSTYPAVIKGLVNLPDVELNVVKKISVIDELIEADPSVKGKLQPVRDSLLNLAPLDMHFSRFSSSMQGMTATMNGISQIFVASGNKSSNSTAGGKSGKGSKNG